MNWIFIALAFVVFIIGFVIWMRRSEDALRQHVSVAEKIISVRRGEVRTDVDISKIIEIQIFEAAAINYFSCWDLLLQGGEKVSINYDAAGVENVLAALEAHCPGFSYKDAKSLISGEDIHGATLTVWKRPN